MYRTLLAIAVVFSLVALSHQDSSCPPIACTPGVTVTGLINDPSDYLSDPTEKLKAQYNLYPGELEVNVGTLALSQLSCYQKCLQYAKSTTDAEVTYFTFIQTCEEGGTCNCYGPPACEADDPDTPSFLPEASTNGVFSYTTGKICQSEIKGDPHLTGGDNSHFDFSGVPNKHFCLISDAHLHINMFLGGWYGDESESGERKAFTWVRKVGLLWGHHAMTFEARAGSEWRYNNGYMARMTVDGQVISLSAPGDSRSLFDGEVELTWLAAKQPSGDDFVDVYGLKIGDSLNMKMTLRPEVASLRTPEDGLVHFTLDFPSLKLSENVHGVLGQTYRKDHLGNFEKQELVHSDLLGVDVVAGDNGEGFLDGTVADYMTSGLLKTDCRTSRFARATKVDLETARAIEMSTGGLSSSYSVMMPMQDVPMAFSR